MASGSRAGGRRIRIAAIALATVLPAAVLATAAEAASRASEPPTAAQVERRTEAFLDRFGGKPLERRGGGVGADPEDPDPEAPDDPAAKDPPLLDSRVAVALYGAPQLTATAVGKRSPSGAARKLRKQAAKYTRAGKGRARRSINLIGVIATASAGSDGKYRARQADEVIRRYLKAARSVSARLTLDIQPGRSPIMRELRALRRWIELPDVDVGIDPEWNVGPKGVPGRTEGSVSAKELNRASRWIDALVEQQNLPAKAMIVHQFRSGSIEGRGKLRNRDGAGVLLNFDGIGGRSAKKAGYANLATRGTFDGFSLFYDRDIDLLSPRGVLRLRPRVDYAMYQ